MPLPKPGTPWPPKDLAKITSKLTEWDAWYTGDRQKLTAVYQTAGDRPRVHTSQHRGGLVGTVARWLWGTPPADVTRDTRLHIPLAADMATASADMLLAEPPTITIDNSAAQDRIQAALLDGLHTELATAADVMAGLGGAFLRATWDQDINPTASFASIVHADAAWPTFVYGRLRSVVFWHVVATDGSTVRRHVESHEIEDGIGVIYHGLYEGTGSDLGKLIPLAADPATASLAATSDTDSASTVRISTMSPGLDVFYAPNQTPARLWRHDPIGYALGRSDFDQVEPVFDALDEAWTSWMRDIRLGRGRLLVPEQFLEDRGPGKGATFDSEREAFVGMKGLAPGRAGDEKMAIEIAQFAIRVDEHQRTCAELIRTAARTGGYAATTFGQEEAVAQTATEVDSKDSRSALTRKRKIRNLTPAIAALVAKMLLIDKHVLGQQGFDVPGRPSVEFAPQAQVSPKVRGETVALWEQARAASTYVKVAWVHPEWAKPDIEDEVARILEEQARLNPIAADPFTIGQEPSPSLGDSDAVENDPAAVKERADAMGVLIRAGVEPAEAAQQVGMAGLTFTGAVPTSLRLPETDAAGLEQA